jgi:hypothetical protein
VWSTPIHTRALKMSLSRPSDGGESPSILARYGASDASARKYSPERPTDRPIVFTPSGRAGPNRLPSIHHTDGTTRLARARAAWAADGLDRSAARDYKYGGSKEAVAPRRAPHGLLLHRLSSSSRRRGTGSAGRFRRAPEEVPTTRVAAADSLKSLLVVSPTKSSNSLAGPLQQRRAAPPSTAGTPTPPSSCSDNSDPPSLFS